MIAVNHFAEGPEGLGLARRNGGGRPSAVRP